jgi:hypothetical protein
VGVPAACVKGTEFFGVRELIPLEATFLRQQPREELPTAPKGRLC